MEDSTSLFAKACRLMPGGVNSPVRACREVGCPPLFIASASGSRLITVEGYDLIDYVLSFGPMILGHGHPAVVEALHAAVARGVSYGAPCPDEVALAQAVVEAMPGIDMLRMVNSGTEATMSAVRVARGFTGRTRIVKFIGGYHGHADGFLAAAGSGVASLDIQGTPGVPEAIVRQTLLAPYNDLEAVRQLFATYPREIAAVIVEPLACNMGLVTPLPGFLEGLREVTARYGALLIFDEVITGFRVAYGGAQEVYGINPDLTCLGKILGGGLPVGAFGGKRQIMEVVAPTGDVYQAGTLAGNPLAMAAGLATLKELKHADYAALAARTRDFAEALAGILREKHVPVCCNQSASLFTIFFGPGPVTNFRQVQDCDAKLYASFYRQMRQEGVALSPSPHECGFLSFAHTAVDVDLTLEAARKVHF